jgi:hypothetical protein
MIMMNTLPLVPDLKWVSREDSQFKLRYLDVRSFTTTMVSTTTDQKLSNKFIELRKSNGDHIKDTTPDQPIHVDCQLIYPHQGQTRDGALYLAREMEDKWDVYLFDGIIYFARSWSGVLVYKAAIAFMDTQAIISNIDAIRQTTIGGSWVTICAVDFLVKSHLYRREAPHILPPSIPNDDMGIAAYSFQEYGRWASFATYEDTTRIRIEECPRRG